MEKFDPEKLREARNVMPNIIAHDIVGVSPMKGPTMLILEMRDIGRLLQLADELDDMCRAEYDVKDFKNALDKFTNLYKRSSDKVQSEYHRKFAEKMKND